MIDSEELSRLAELHQRGVLTDAEFAQAKAKILDGVGAMGGMAGGPSAAFAAPRGAPAVDAINALKRSRDDRWIGGVCGGIARLSGLASWFWRIVFLMLVMCAGSGFLLYLLLWIFVPLED